MRYFTIIIAIVALHTLAGTVAQAGPVNSSLVCKAAVSLSQLEPARCICARRGFHGRCYRWSCR
jgi:hypothetical protein